MVIVVMVIAEPKLCMPDVTTMAGALSAVARDSSLMCMPHITTMAGALTAIARDASHMCMPHITNMAMSTVISNEYGRGPYSSGERFIPHVGQICQQLAQQSVADLAAYAQLLARVNAILIGDACLS